MAAVSKVEYNGRVLIDLTSDTVTPETLAEGYTAHGADGELIVGTMKATEDLNAVLQSKTVTPTKETQDVTADNGYTALEKVTVKAIPSEYIIPSGTKSITENGTHDAKAYESVNVNVPVPDGYIKPSGEIEITENGTHDVTEYASVNVNVEASGGESDIPAGYSLVDYIEFNGKQLVDTGIIGNQDTQIQTSFTWGNATQNHVFGCASPDNTASITSYMNGSWRFGNKSVTKTIQKNNTLLPYVARVNKTAIGVTGSNSTISDVNDFETIGTLLLGGARSATGALPGSGIVGKVLYFNVWDGSTQIMKLIPVTDGKVFRFYDRISKAFFDSMTDTPLEGGNL